ncbi:MAG: hypothetical protein CL607_28140 [Anaerolineaceae bacterium]|nr:hypothetical protein [Anaerolineaceae bacterium]
MGDRIFNFISVLALLASILVMAGVAYVFTQPNTRQEAIQQTELAFLPPTAFLASPTPSQVPTETPIPSPTFPPTFTATFTETLSPTPSETYTPTVTPSPTITNTVGPTFTPTITETPTITATPSISPTFTPSITPTGPTPIPPATVSPYLFNQREPTQFVANFANAAGCLWQGMGGAVYTLDNQPVPLESGYQVHVFNDLFDRYVNVGSNSQYGAASGWEMALDTQPNNQLYFVVLESSIGTELSPRIQVQFPGTCEGNTALINFRQTR